MSFAPRTLRTLDEVQGLAGLERFDAAACLATLRAELPPPGATLEELGAQLDGLRALLEEVDRFAQKSMRLRLGASPEPLPRQLQTLVQTTILAYQHDLPLLRGRIAPGLARTSGDATAATERIMQAAEQVLAARATLHQGVVEVAAAAATAWLPIALRAIRDRSQPDEGRARWKRAGVDLAAVAASPETLETGSFAERLERIPTPDDPPDEELPDRFSLLELD